jgi:hypothetical protein
MLHQPRHFLKATLLFGFHVSGDARHIFRVVWDTQLIRMPIAELDALFRARPQQSSCHQPAGCEPASKGDPTRFGLLHDITDNS